jgi:NAD(P)-dependent dehydrogenase (short-subunit alcohol dehydrogenase family)
VPTEDFRKVMDVNVNGAFIMSRNVARGMAKRGSGAIVGITLIGGITTSPGTHAYASSKAGLAALTQLMAPELGPLGIRVNCVAPGFIDAGMFQVTESAHSKRSGGASQTHGPAAGRGQRRAVPRLGLSLLHQRPPARGRRRGEPERADAIAAALMANVSLEVLSERHSKL